MIKYLIKLQTNLNYPSTLYSKYILNQYLKCGDSYKNGTKHLFYSDDPTDHILIKEIFKRFKLPVVITNVKKESFEFESSNEILQIFLFRLCRYVRQVSIKKILEDTIIINKVGVTIHNAFLLAHYNNMSCSYYNETMDIVKNFKTNYIVKSFV